MDDTLCSHFLKALTDFRNVGVVQLGKSLVSQARAISQGPEQESCPVLETVFLEEDVGELCEVLASVSYKWEELCVSLKLSKAVIEECRNARNNNLRLYRGLTEWVCGRHKNARHPTLSQLKQALSSPFVGLPDLALKIEKSWKTNNDLQDSHFTGILSESNKILNISSEPSDTTVADGKSTLLEVQVSHSEAVSFQWMKEDKPLSDSSSFSGTHSSMLLIHKTSQGVQGEYCCQVNLGSVQLSTSPVQVTVTFPPDKQRLLELYSNLNEVPQDSWPLVAPNKYVNILLININQNAGPSTVREGIEDIVGTSCCSPTEVFSQYVEGALIILQGCPGSGKTTLANKITKDWVNGKMLRKADKVFLISLRKDYEKMELFKRFYHSRAQSYVKQLEECGGKGSCFVLDGYDEFSNSQGEQSVIHQLIHKTYLPLAMVILTSRPAATATLHFDIKRVYYYESVGFSKESFEEFVDCYLFQHTTLEKYRSDTIKSQLKDYLKACSNILNICFLPLNASMICFLFDSLREVKNTPKTETEMYKHFVLAIALRKLRIANPKFKLHSQEYLPDSDNVIFKQLCLLAFNMTMENKQIVKLPVPLESIDSSSLRGLLTIDSTIGISGLEDTVVFLHLTLQEYLAACHLASLDEHQQTEMIRLHSGKGHMLTMFKFYCGLVDFQNKLQQFDDIVESAPNILYGIHCAYETQLESICHRVMEDSLCIESCVLTPADFHVMAYVVSCASHLVKQVMIQPCILYEEYKDKWKSKEIGSAELMSSSFAQSNFDLASIKSKAEYDICNQVSYKQFNYPCRVTKNLEAVNNILCSLQNEFSTLYQSCSDIFSSEYAAPLADALRHCGNIEVMILYGTFNSTETAYLLQDVFKNSPNLTFFQLYEYSCFSKAEHLTTTIQQCCKFDFLLFKSTDLHGKCMTDLSHLLPQCTNLRTLALPYCNIHSEDALLLAKSLANSSLKLLNLGENNICSEGMQSLAKNVHCEQLNLNSCNIGNEGAKHLAEYLTKNPSVTALVLQNNNIGSQGITALAEGLRHCSNLQVLILSNNYIEYGGAIALAEGLKFCSKLKVLNLNNCNINTGGILCITEQFHWKELVHLELAKNGISDVFPALTQKMKYLNCLEKLNLCSNSIGSRGAIVLAEGIQSCPSLHDLNVCNNDIGSDGAMAIFKAFNSSNSRRDSTSEQLISMLTPGLPQQNIVAVLDIDFSRNKLDEFCIDSLIALVKSNKIVKLDLSYNNIGPNGSKLLVSELLNFELSLEINLVHNNISDKDIKLITQLLPAKKLHEGIFEVFL